MVDIERSYVTLGLKVGASPEEVKEAYRDLVKVWHPDRFPEDTRLNKKAHDKLKEITKPMRRYRKRLADVRELEQWRQLIQNSTEEQRLYLLRQFKDEEPLRELQRRNGDPRVNGARQKQPGYLTCVACGAANGPRVGDLKS